MRAGRILLDTYSVQAEQWCWRAAWHIHGESAWTLLWKFALLNQVTAREVARLSVSSRCGRRVTMCAKPNVDLRDGNMFDLETLSGMFRVPKSIMRRAFLFEVLPGSALRSRDFLRWCPECMARGFHSPLYQMRLTRTCPLHNRPLIDRCLHCAQQIPYKMTREFMASPFKCPHCGIGLAPTMMKDRPDIMRLRKEQISRLSLLLKFHRAADAELVSVTDADRLFVSAERAGITYVSMNELDIHSHYAGFIAQVLEDVAPGLHQRQRGLRFEPVARHECGSPRTPHWDIDVEVDETLGEGGSLPDIYFTALLNTYKTVRRHLWRHRLRSHRRCIKSAAARLWWHIDGETTCAFCPFAIAFIRWRMMWEGCGTPRYLFRRPSVEYYGVLGWHLSRPALTPDHWSEATKAWVMDHIFSNSALAAFDEMLRDATACCDPDLVTWNRPKSPVDYTCLWAVAGRDCADRPALVYVQRQRPAQRLPLPSVEENHWGHHLASISRLCR